MTFAGDAEKLNTVEALIYENGGFEKSLELQAAAAMEAARDGDGSASTETMLR